MDCIYWRRDTVGRVVDFMTAQGIKMIEGVTPSGIEKLDSGRLLVRFSDGRPAEEFDTVLAAVGRRADTHALGLESIGVRTNPSNGKIMGVNEQSSVPNVYAIGDVLEGAPELTPVAIMAGKLLAGRLFGGANTSMDYSMVPTAVFTPLEMGNVGLSEEAAIEKYGADNIDCVVSAFHPLEWTLNEAHHSGIFSFAKVSSTYFPLVAMYCH
jgi:thioredoxin reductase (NADPH)